MNLVALPWYGGKSVTAPSGLGKWVTSLLPTDAEVYIEPFAGMLGVLLQREPARMEIINDLDRNVAAFWKTLRNLPDALEALLEATEYGYDVYLEALQTLTESNITDLRRAWALIVAAGQSIGHPSSWSSSAWRRPGHIRTSKYNVARKFDAVCLRLTCEQMRARLRNIHVDNRDATEIISRYATNPEVLLYVDPPYAGNYTAYGATVNNDLTNQILEIITADTCKARVAVSGYPTCEFSALTAHGWFESQLQVLATASANNDQTPRTECLWTNYQPTPPQPTLL